jgi:hypothetical protein
MINMIYTLLFMWVVSATALTFNSEEGPIVLGGIHFPSREAFYETGARSRTIEPDESQMKQYENEIEFVTDDDDDDDDIEEDVSSDCDEDCFIDSESETQVFEEDDDTDGDINDESEDAFAAKKSTKHIVKVFFHIIKSSSGAGAVSDKVVKKQLKVLNKAYGPHKFKFKLGAINRVTNNGWYKCSYSDKQCQDHLKKSLRKGSYGVLNVYTTKQDDSTLGWTTYPVQVGNDYHFDGVIIDFRTMPDHKEFYPYNKGNTLTHEVGHWFGLAHTFQGGCTMSYKGGDYVKDTHAGARPLFGCPSDKTNTCPGTREALMGNDPVHNYMNYVDDRCMTAFTPGQGERMRKMWKKYRNNK